jgi:hypothetical protein
MPGLRRREFIMLLAARRTLAAGDAHGSSSPTIVEWLQP